MNLLPPTHAVTDPLPNPYASRDLLEPAPQSPAPATTPETPPDSTEDPSLPTDANSTSPNPKRNSLSFAKRSKLWAFLDAEAVRLRLPHEPDRVFAEEATAALGFPITTPNVTNLRLDMGISKIKPEPPAPPAVAVADVDLADLLRRLQSLEQRPQGDHDPIKAATTDEVIRKLQERVEHLESIVTSNAQLNQLIVPAGSPLHPSHSAQTLAPAPASLPNAA